MSDPRYSNPIDPRRSADIAAATYHEALPEVIAEVEAGSDYMQVRLDGDLLVIATRGTDDFEDNKSNAHTHPHKFHGFGRAHGGFAKAADLLLPKLREAIRDYAGYPISLNGHSRGGTISQCVSPVIAFDWDEHVSKIELLTTFGAPHVGNRKMCDSIEQACRVIRRYENRTLPIPFFRDPVPHTPPSPRYHSPGKATYLFTIGPPLRQHSMSTYQKTISKHIKKATAD